MKDKNSVYMCMSCGNCKRTDDGLSFKFNCKCGDFPIDSAFAARIEFIGCRSWSPADDNYNEPYIIKIDEKHRTVEIGKWGGSFADLGSDELVNIADAYDDGEEFSRLIDICKEASGEI